MYVLTQWLGVICSGVSQVVREKESPQVHKLYAFLAQGLTPVMRKDCISSAICASSTDNCFEESIWNTLEERDRVEDRASYWSSKGGIDPAVPETLLYKLIANLCIVSEINLQPFQAYFQYDSPIYSPKAVCFRMVHARFPMELDSEIADEFVPAQNNVEEKFRWTYISPEFPMAQVASVRESQSEDKRFSIFTGTKTLHLWVGEHEDKVAWMEALSAIKGMFPRVSNSELLALTADVSVSTVKLRQHLLEEGVKEAAIRDAEQIMRDEFSSLHDQLVVLKQKQFFLVDTLSQLEDRSVRDL